MHDGKQKKNVGPGEGSLLRATMARWFALFAGSLLGGWLLLLAVANGPAHIGEQLTQLWPYLLPLVGGFGLQGSLFAFLRARMHAAGRAVAGSGGMNAGSMAACCAHHVTDVLPALGASALGLFLVQFQGLFLLGGVLSNLVGILYMLSVIQRAGLATQGLRTTIFRFPLFPVTKGAGILSAAALTLLFASATAGWSPLPAPAGAVTLAPLQLEQGGLTIRASPAPLAFGQPWQVDLRLDTHSGDLGADLAAAASLRDDEGRTYQATWEGPPPGGHHLSGALRFPPLPPTRQVELLLRGVQGTDWRFPWEVA